MQNLRQLPKMVKHTNFKGDYISVRDVEIAKNYLSEKATIKDFLIVQKEGAREVR